jgi:mRNA-degrading endonuclease RelE of RelBE toxin-antitoxin system
MPYEVWLSEEAAKERKLLSKEQERKLMWWRDRLARDVTVGDPIRKSQIPATLKRAYEINNLWRLELPGGWRVLYTVASRPAGKPEVFILRILSHEEYDRLFGYSNS